MRLAHGVHLLAVSVDIVAVAEALDAGSLQGVLVDGSVVLRDEGGQSPEEDPHALLVGRDASGEVILADIEVQTAEALRGLGDGGGLEVPDGQRRALLSLGLIVPIAWDICTE